MCMSGAGLERCCVNLGYKGASSSSLLVPSTGMAKSLPAPPCPRLTSLYCPVEGCRQLCG